MTKDTPYPHRERRSAIHFIIALGFLTILALALFGCSPQKNGCPAVRNMSGYSYMKCKETGKVAVFGPDGKLICIYKEK